MIVWIFFSPGVGGDGFANLLEHSTNAVTIDKNKQWRIHRYVDFKVKFWAPTLQNTNFRLNTIDLLDDYQIAIANSNTEYLIITSHDVELKKTFLQNKIPKKKHINILLTSDNYYNQQLNFYIKNLVEFDQSILNNEPTKSLPALTNMDFIVDIDKIINCWEYTKQLTTQIGLELDQKQFNHYQKIINGEILYNTPGIDYFVSSVDSDGITRYTKTN